MLLKCIVSIGGRYSEWSGFLYKNMLKELIKQVFPTLDSAFPLFMFRCQHEMWKILIRVENSLWPLARQINTIKYNAYCYLST